MTPTEEKAFMADVLEKVEDVHGTTLRGAVALTGAFHEFKGAVSTNLASITETLNGDGNGKPGLKILMDRVTIGNAAMWKKIDRMEDNRRKWFWTLTPIVLGLLIADIYLKLKGG